MGYHVAMKSLVSIIFLPLCLYAGGPLLGVLKNVEDNRFTEFGIKEYSYRCQPYGVLTLEELVEKSGPQSRCRESVEKFYAVEPLSRHFAQRLLKREQLYHIEPKEKGCVLYAKGMRSYSELLLAEGLAVRKPLFNDEEWLYRFKQAQKKAKYEKKGLWNERIWIDCVASLYAVEE